MDIETNIARATTSNCLENHNYYKNDNPHLGNALIFCTTNKPYNSESNVINQNKIRLVDILEKYGFEVRVYDNYNYIQIISILKQVSEEDHSQNDCILTVIISDEEGLFSSSVDFYSPFLWNECTLKNKPKLFFIDANRENKLNYGRIYTDASHEKPQLFGGRIAKVTETYSIPRTTDWFIHFCVFEGYRTLYNDQMGSWFIESLSDTLEIFLKDITVYEKNSKYFDIYELANAVNRTVAYRYQSEKTNYKSLSGAKLMPTYSSSLTKLFIIKPKSKVIHK